MMLQELICPQLKPLSPPTIRKMPTVVVTLEGEIVKTPFIAGQLDVGEAARKIQGFLLTIRENGNGHYTKCAQRKVGFMNSNSH